MNQLGGRKYIYSLLVTAAGFSLVLLKVATAAEWFGFVQIVAVLFFGSNVGDKITSVLNKNDNLVG